MPMLVLNKRDLLEDLPRWFPDSRDALVVLTSREALTRRGLSAARLAARFRHLEVVDDYESAAALARAARLCRDHGVHRVLTTAEGDLLRAAELRRDLALPGQDVTSATAYRDKFTMKSLAAAAGVPVAPMRLVRTPHELRAFAAEHGLPIVVKLPSGKGSVGQTVPRDQRALADFTRTWEAAGGPRPLLAEAWVEADMYHVDGLMNAGEVLQASAQRYLYPQWETASRSRAFVTGMLPADDPDAERLCALTARVVAALPPPPGLHPFHAEFFRRDDGELLLCEIACRAGGARIVETHRLTHGVDLYEAALKGQAGRGEEIPLKEPCGRAGSATFPPRHGVLRSLPRDCPLPGAFGYTASGVPGRRYHGATSVADSVASVLFRIGDGDLLERLRSFEAWWEGAVRWEWEGT